VLSSRGVGGVGLTQIRRAQLLGRAVPWRALSRQTLPRQQALLGQGSDRQERARFPPRNFEELQRQFLCEIKQVCWCALNSYVHLAQTFYRDCFGVVVCRATASAVERWLPAERSPIRFLFFTVQFLAPKSKIFEINESRELFIMGVFSARPAVRKTLLTSLDSKTQYSIQGGKISGGFPGLAAVYGILCPLTK